MLKLKGFTIIELALTIALLGILAAFSIPRFANLESTIMKGMNAQVFASFESSVNLAHEIWVASNQPSSISMENSSIPMSSTGYPGATSMTTSLCVSLWNDLQNTNTKTSTTYNVGDDSYYTAASGAICGYLYQKKGASRYLIYTPNTGKIIIANP